MEILEVAGVRLSGVAACIPEGRIANDPKVAMATGIPARAVAPAEESSASLCIRAARRVLEETASSPADFGAVLAVSFTQSCRMPGNAAQAQAELGLSTGVLAFDLLQACAGWGYGLYLAALLARQTGRKVLLLDGDKQSDFLDASDPATSPLLSDGGTAAVIEPDDSIRTPWKFAFATDGRKGAALRLPKDGFIQMDGFGVFRFVATDVVAFLKEFSEYAKVSPEAVFVPHQPNVYLVRQLAKSLGCDASTLVSADLFGNLSSASIPATLVAHAARWSERKDGKHVLISGFGGGLSISASYLEILPSCRFALLTGSDEI